MTLQTLSGLCQPSTMNSQSGEVFRIANHRIILTSELLLPLYMGIVSKENEQKYESQQGDESNVGRW
jgi:hypothetical protein